MSILDRCNGPCHNACKPDGSGYEYLGHDFALPPLPWETRIWLGDDEHVWLLVRVEHITLVTQVPDQARDHVANIRLAQHLLSLLRECTRLIGIRTAYFDLMMRDARAKLRIVW